MESIPPAAEEDVLRTALGAMESVHRTVAQSCRLVLEKRAPITATPGKAELLRWIKLDGVDWPPLGDFEDIGGPPQSDSEAIVDPLGCYFFQGTDAPINEPFVNQSRIELYWHNIGVVAKKLGISIPDLTVVVLAHEVAHEFTHLGADLDGCRWPSGRFALVSTTAHEALAQHYCEEALRLMTGEHPGALDAFTRLLAVQSRVYTKRWPMMNKGAEGVRHGLLSMRKVDPNTRGAIMEILIGDQAPKVR